LKTGSLTVLFFQNDFIVGFTIVYFRKM